MRSHAVEPARLSARAAATVQSEATATVSGRPDIEGPTLDEDDVETVTDAAENVLQKAQNALKESGLVEENPELETLADIDVKATSKAVGQALNAIQGNLDTEGLDPAAKIALCAKLGCMGGMGVASGDGEYIKKMSSFEKTVFLAIFVGLIAWVMQKAKKAN